MTRPLLTPLDVTDGIPEGFTFWCPGCECSHEIQIRTAAGSGYPYNGNPSAPTFDGVIYAEGDLPACELWITNGEIVYGSYCAHALAGKTVPLVPDPEAP